MMGLFRAYKMLPAHVKYSPSNQHCHWDGQYHVTKNCNDLATHGICNHRDQVIHFFGLTISSINTGSNGGSGHGWLLSGYRKMQNMNQNKTQAIIQTKQQRLSEWR